jgi:methyl-accepting chemotaxis protein
MDKTLETIMGWSIAIGIPLLIYYLQDSAAASKQSRDIALQQAQREQSIAYDVQSLKSTIERNSTVLDDVADEVRDIRERLVRVETKVTP